MNVIADSSVWFEYLKGKEPYFSKVQDLLNSLNISIIDPIIGEILQGALHQKDINFIRRHIQFVPKIEIKNLFEKAGEYAFRNKLTAKGIGINDAAIIFAAIDSGSVIWTLDKKMITYLESKYLFHPE
jgi:predicted nucleic acid-binding protein